MLNPVLQQRFSPGRQGQPSRKEVLAQCWKEALHTGRDKDREVQQLLWALACLPRGAQWDRAMEQFRLKVSSEFESMNLLETHDPGWTHPDVLKEYEEGAFLMGHSQQGSPICEGTPEELTRIMGVFGLTGMGKSEGALSLSEQAVKEQNPGLVLWAFSKSRQWQQARLWDRNVNIWTFHRSRTGPLTTLYRLNPFESPVPGLEEDWWPLAVEAMAAVRHATVAFRSNLLRMLRDPRRKERGIPTFSKLIRWAEWVKKTGDKEPGRNFLGYDDAVRDRISASLQYYLDEGKEMFRAERGIGIEKLLPMHNVWDLSKLGQDTYELIVVFHLMALFWYKQVIPSSQKLIHILVVDDALKLVQRQGGADGDISPLAVLATEARKYNIRLIYISQVVKELDPIILKQTQTFWTFRVDFTDEEYLSRAMGIEKPGQLTTQQRQEFMLYRENIGSTPVNGRVPDRVPVEVDEHFEAETVRMMEERKGWLHENVVEERAKAQKDDQDDDNDEKDTDLAPGPELKKLLKAVRDDPTETVAEKAESCGISEKKVRRLLSTGVRKGLLSEFEGEVKLRVSVGAGAPRQYYCLTGKGQEAVGRMKLAREGVYHAVMARAAEEHCRAVFPSAKFEKELSVGGGKTIDLAVIWEGKALGIEIASPHTKASHEARDNLVKGHKAGFRKVASIAASAQLRDGIRNEAESILNPEQMKSTLFLTLNAFQKMKRNELE